MRNHRSHLRVWLALLCCTAITGSEAVAIDPGACCVQSTSRLETLVNPNKGSDENFFTASSGAPNIMLLLDTSCSMNNWPEAWPSAAGCNHPGFAGSGYNAAIDYRGFIDKISGNPMEDPKWFDDSKVYEVDRTSYGHDFTGAGGPVALNWPSQDAACTVATGSATGVGQHPACLTCLATAGYYVGANKKIGTGNYLEFYSPRDVAAIMVLSQLIYDVREIRLGIMTFDSWGSNACWALTTSTSAGGKASCTTGGIQRCHDLSSDPNNCGACGVICPTGQLCDSSTCVPQPGCPNGLTLCGTACVNVDDNPANCGSCGNVCGGASWRRCGSTNDGQCTAGHSNCGAGRTDCSGTCVVVTDDPNNCGGCGVVCAANQYCNSSSCTVRPSCDNGLSSWAQADGGVACANRESNPLFCGPTGLTCGAAQECNGDNNGQCRNLSCTGSTSNGKVCLWQAQNPSCDKMYPFDQSSTENSRNSILNALAKDNAFTMSTPLATILYAAGYHLRSRSPDGFSALFAPGFPGDTAAIRSRLDEPALAKDKGICSACGFNAAIVLTDGSPNNELLGSMPSQITSLTTMTNAACPAGAGFCDSYLDEVAAFLWTNDIRADMPGKQSIATYTIGFATTSTTNQLLKSTALTGGGRYYPAKGAAAVKEALLAIFDDINARNNSFASSATVAVQAGSNSTPALLPRMQPKAGQPWEGKLWRFEQYNEFVESGATIADLNGDGDNEDIFIVDAVNPTVANVVTETADGIFVRNNTSTPATPFWEANAKLVADMTASGFNSRKVWTVVDSNGDGAFTETDTLTSFQPGTDVQDLKMAEYMGLVGSAFCPSAVNNGSILTKFGMSLPDAETAVGYSLPGSPTEANYARLCARIVMRWFHGMDFFDVDGDGVRNEARPSIIGDIFHASPVLVDAPVDTFLCELGLSNQCARTLYSQTLGAVAATPTPVEMTTLVGNGACINANKTAYEAYVWDQRRRDKVVLVGANDGMVHAFLSGRFTGTETCTGSQPLPTFTKGTGQELWAFIPPDLLPKLPDSILSHEYLVDGDIMVRDIWADTAAPYGSKAKSEFHTLAVVAEGRGGKHYFALEMKYDATGTSMDQPGFRWMFPQPCSAEASTFGKTLFALSPKAPPIGPVLIDNSQLPVAIANPITRYGVPTHERWMVALSGGWSPGLEKGRGIYMVDAWNGTINGRRDNLWWKMEFDEGASGANDAPLKGMVTSITAPVAMVDYGPDDAPAQDGFFDTAVVGDTFGQLWVARMQTPGRFTSTGNRFAINNWYGARAFEMDRYGAVGSGFSITLADGGVEVPDLNAKGFSNKSPFFYLPSVAIEPGTDRMRVFAGTGNRYAILEEGAGSCRFDNPAACSKSRCDDMKIVSKYKDGVVDGDAETHWKSRRFEHGKETVSINRNPDAVLSVADMCGSNGSKRVESENVDFKTGTCAVSGPDVTPGKVNEVKYECGLNASGSSFSCTQKSITRKTTDLLVPADVDTSGLGNNRFVGVWAYGGAQADGGYRGFSGTSGVTPNNYDVARITDRAGVLYDVTNVNCVADKSCDGGAPEDSYGWFYDYGQLSRKTATGAAVIASCVLWSDLSPSGGDGGACGAGVTPLSGIYQADFITGQPNCAFSFKPPDGGAFTRSQTRTVVAPPPEPASVVQISKAGEVRYSAMIVEPGKGQATTVNVSGGEDVLQLVYELPISRSLHNCRHADAGCITAP